MPNGKHTKRSPAAKQQLRQAVQALLRSGASSSKSGSAAGAQSAAAPRAGRKGKVGTLLRAVRKGKAAKQASSLRQVAPHSGHLRNSQLPPHDVQTSFEDYEAYSQMCSMRPDLLGAVYSRFGLNPQPAVAISMTAAKMYNLPAGNMLAIYFTPEKEDDATSRTLCRTFLAPVGTDYTAVNLDYVKYLTKFSDIVPDNEPEYANDAGDRFAQYGPGQLRISITPPDALVGPPSILAVGPANMHTRVQEDHLETAPVSGQMNEIGPTTIPQRHSLHPIGTPILGSEFPTVVPEFGWNLTCNIAPLIGVGDVQRFMRPTSGNLTGPLALATAHQYGCVFIHNRHATGAMSVSMEGMRQFNVAINPRTASAMPERYLTKYSRFALPASLADSVAHGVGANHRDSMMNAVNTAMSSAGVTPHAALRGIHNTLAKAGVRAKAALNHSNSAASRVVHAAATAGMVGIAGHQAYTAGKAIATKAGLISEAPAEVPGKALSFVEEAEGVVAEAAPALEEILPILAL